MTPEQLWEKYCKPEMIDNHFYDVMREKDFLAALHEYGESVRKQAVSVCRPRTKRPCDCEVCDCGNSGNLQAVTFWDEANYCAAAIEKMEISH